LYRETVSNPDARVFSHHTRLLTRKSAVLRVVDRNTMLRSWRTTILRSQNRIRHRCENNDAATSVMIDRAAKIRCDPEVRRFQDCQRHPEHRCADIGSGILVTHDSVVKTIPDPDARWL
jgi:hypothetical protein